ncbi:hypothetical protein ACP70R_027452 [Stipagrostis hirtigluma subsp. patula]
MAPSRRLATPTLFVLLLLVATEIGMNKVAEARKCFSQSDGFHGTCFLDSKTCNQMCIYEKADRGECRVFRAWRRCVCERDCSDQAANGPPAV